MRNQLEQLIRKTIQETMGNRFDSIESKQDKMEEKFDLMLLNHIPHLAAKVTEIKLDQKEMKADVMELRINQKEVKTDIRWVKWLVCSILCGGVLSILATIVLRALFG